METPLRILVRGSGDIGSAVAHRLFGAGYAVAIHEIPRPTATRRKMAFTDAVFDGFAVLDGVEARRVEKLSCLRAVLLSPTFIPILVHDFSRLLEKLRPHVLVDARMRKHVQPGGQIQMAPLTLGLGPNFVAGTTVHVAIETAWGDDLGRVITRGETMPLTGEPREIEGQTRGRYVYAPCAGVFRTTHQIGDAVLMGQEIARIGDTLLYAPISGVLRGLTHDHVPVRVKTKAIEIDPRSIQPQISGIAERPARIADGVLQAIQQWDRSRI